MDQVTIDLLHVALNINQAKHKVATQNIAVANMKDMPRTSISFDSLLSKLNSVDDNQKATLLNEIKNNWDQIEKSSLTTNSNEDIKLDKETADVLLASGKYKLIAESLNRKLGLMKLSVNGGRR